jgi:precorrin-2 dehydrogenase / sirohydrochlorin ferrochelatase
VKTYTVCLVGLQSRIAVVIGGGEVAAQKIKGLLKAEVQIKVISPVLNAELQSLAEDGKITHIRRNYQEGDLAGAFLAIAATDKAAVNHAVWSEAQRRDCLVNVVDDPTHSSFIVPAMLQRGDMSIAITTGGGSPALARRLRERLELEIGTEYGTLNEIMAELRPELKQSYPSSQERLNAALRVIDSDILKVIREQGREAALAYAKEQLSQQR